MPRAFRPAGPPDAGEVAALMRRAYAGWVPVIGRPPKPMLADYGRAIREHVVFVVDDGAGAAAGDAAGDAATAAVLELVPHPDHMLVENVAVDPAWQGCGLGRALMALAEAEARRRGLLELRLYTNERFEANLRLYNRLGYRETERRPLGGSALVFMAKALDDGPAIDREAPRRDDGAP